MAHREDNFDEFMKANPQTGKYSDEKAQNVIEDVRKLAKQKTIIAAWVGITTRGKEGCRKHWKNKFSIVGMQRITRGYHTTSFRHAESMKKELQRRYDLYRPERVQNDDDNRGIPRDKDSYTVYVAWTTDRNYKPPEIVAFDDALVHRDEEPDVLEGKLDEKADASLISSLKRKISAHTRNGAPFWIGITSSDDEGCKNRWNQKYKYYGMNKMRMLLSTEDEETCREMEKLLIDYYEEYVENEIGGGGGKLGDPPYILYLTWKRD